MNDSQKQALCASGIAYDEVVNRFMGKEALAEKFFIKFLDDKNLPDLKQALEEGNAELAFRYAHTLKGVCANLGMKAINDKLVPLVEKLRNSETDNTDEYMKQTEDAYNAVCEAIRTLL